jgi:hypothetical protein
MDLVIKLSLSFFWQSVGTSHRAHRQAKAQCSALPTSPHSLPEEKMQYIFIFKGQHPELQVVISSAGN